jgi:hypothetical protein
MVLQQQLKPLRTNHDQEASDTNQSRLSIAIRSPKGPIRKSIRRKREHESRSPSITTSIRPTHASLVTEARHREQETLQGQPTRLAVSHQHKLARSSDFALFCVELTCE